LDDLLGGVLGARTDQHGDLGAGVEDVSGAAQLGRGRNHPRLGPAHAGEHRAVLARRGLDRLGLGDVLRDDHCRHGAVGQRDLAGPVDQMPRLPGHHARLDEVRCDVLVQRVRVDLLLERRPQPDALLLTEDRHHRLVVELGVVEPVEQVDRAPARGGHRAPDLAGELGVGGRHERRHLLVAGLDQLRVPIGAVQRSEHRVDPIAGIAVDAVDAPLTQALEQVVRDEHGLASLPSTNRAFHIVVRDARRVCCLRCKWYD